MMVWMGSLKNNNKQALKHLPIKKNADLEEQVEGVISVALCRDTTNGLQEPAG